MGQIIGSIAGIAGSIIGGDAEAHADENAANAALTGYNYLAPGGAGNAAQSTFINNGVASSNAQQGTQGAIAGLLGQGPNSAANQAAFNNYLGSTGYQFQLGQGTQAINANAATSGLLQSGANAKALAGYGQNLASTTFNNYLGQLGGLNAAQGATATTGLQANTAIGQAGSAGGAAAANALTQGGNAIGGAYAGAGGAIQGLANNYTSPSNFLSSVF